MIKSSKKENSQYKSSLWSKIGKSLATLALLFGLVSVTNFKINWFSWIVVVSIFVFLAVYWHFLEILYHTIKDIKTYFKELKEDVKYIKKRIGKK